MLFCNRCGQSPHISDDNFKEVRNTYGWEVAYVNPHDGDTEDWGDSEVTDSDHANYECPYCGSDDVDFDSGQSDIQAHDLRRSFDRAAEQAAALREEQRKQFEYERKAKDPSRTWDVETNVVL